MGPENQIRTRHCALPHPHPFCEVVGRSKDSGSERRATQLAPVACVGDGSEDAGAKPFERGTFACHLESRRLSTRSGVYPRRAELVLGAGIPGPEDQLHRSR